ncbi:hypothetical protein TNIN_241231 [Trichonephila inaurata madagascariensis]|uniref:Uncharacterized protein n=1 Tax=Trichonephila inaurata madagascariensis TaxID=2747483 RepID=A0A8X6JWD3_9ARAC|nr:hypothetical protein TNIN_241231 [Trichonephila inaurata madagascariensis]
MARQHSIVQQREQREFDLEKMRLEIERSLFDSGNSSPLKTSVSDLIKIFPNFDIRDGDIVLFLALFERQAKRIGVNKANCSFGTPAVRYDSSNSQRDKKIAFRTRERRKFWVLTDGLQEGKKYLRSCFAGEFIFGGERLAQRKIEPIYFTDGEPGGKDIFGSCAAIEFIFKAVPRVNSRLVKLTTLIVRGGKFKIGQEDHCSW